MDTNIQLKIKNTAQYAGANCKTMNENKLKYNKAIIMMLFANDVLYGTVVDMISSIKKSSLYKREVKQQVKKLESYFSRYQRDIEKRIQSSMEQMMDMFDGKIEKINKDINIAYFSIQSRLSSIGETDCDAKANLVLCESLAYHIMDINKIHLANVKRLGYDPSRLEHLSLSQCHNLLTSIGDLVFKNQMNLSSDKTVRDSFEILVRKLISVFNS